MAIPLLFSWSGGKDSALALHALLEEDAYEVVGLLTSVAGEYGRISHHGVREGLAERQAEAIGLPLEKLDLSSESGQPCTNAVYEAQMGAVLARWRDRGVRHVGHGDIFLEDLRAYRDGNLEQVGMTGVYPLWKLGTGVLAERFISQGFRAILSCVDGEKLGPGFAGRSYDRALLADLPDGIDPCGEHGEFHSFVWDGPLFREPVPVTVGRAVTREGRHYVDLLPEGEDDAGGAAGAVPPVNARPAPGDRGHS